MTNLKIYRKNRDTVIIEPAGDEIIPTLTAKAILDRDGHAAGVQCVRTLTPASEIDWGDKLCLVREYITDAPMRVFPTGDDEWDTRIVFSDDDNTAFLFYALLEERDGAIYPRLAIKETTRAEKSL